MRSPGLAAGGSGGLVARALSHAFGTRSVFSDLSVELRPGAVLALLGPNGAGKTTLFRIFATLLRPTRGSVMLDGWQLPQDAREFRRRIGYVADRPLLYEELSPFENLRFFARLYGLGRAAADARAEALLTRVGVQDRGSPVGALSKGTAQRVALARALVHDPPVLLLDDPYESLDPGFVAALDAALQEWRREGRAVGLITQQPPHALRVADRVVVLREGGFVLDASANTVGVEELQALCSSLAGGG